MRFLTYPSKLTAKTETKFWVTVIVRTRFRKSSILRDLIFCKITVLVLMTFKVNFQDYNALNWKCGLFYKKAKNSSELCSFQIFTTWLFKHFIAQKSFRVHKATRRVCFDLARAILLTFRLYLELNGGHESHQNLWMTYEDGNFTGWHSLETITILYISFLVRFLFRLKRRLKC